MGAVSIEKEGVRVRKLDLIGASKKYGRTSEAIRKLCQRGRFKDADKSIDGRWLIPVDELDAYFYNTAEALIQREVK